MKKLLQVTALNSFSPGRVFLVILLTVFAVEISVICAFFAIFPEGERRIEMLATGSLFTLFNVPVLWCMVLFMLRRQAHSRSQLLQQVIAAQEAERRRIAGDLHDEIGQGLTFLLVGLRTLEEATPLESAKERARELRRIGGQLHDEIRRLARGLRPSVLDDLGLNDALIRYTEEYRHNHGIALAVVLPEDATRFPEAVETALYRIAQEALNNVAKHAKAGRVDLFVAREPGGVRMIVCDDGCGFDPAEALQRASASGNLGLRSISDRVTFLHGSMTLESNRGEGTTMTVEIPLVEAPRPAPVPVIPAPLGSN